MIAIEVAINQDPFGRRLDRRPDGSQNDWYGWLVGGGIAVADFSHIEIPFDAPRDERVQQRARRHDGGLQRHESDFVSAIALEIAQWSNAPLPNADCPAAS